MNILSDFHPDGRFKQGHKMFSPTKNINCDLCDKSFLPNSFVQRYCSDCRILKRKEYHRKYDNSEKKRLASRRYFAKEENRPKYQARWHVNEAVRKGKINKPDNCEYCVKIGSVYAHHYLGYDKKNRLTIIWLCAKCHSNEHSKEAVSYVEIQ